MRRGTELVSSRESGSTGLPGRLSSSTSAIRARDYSRSYGETPARTTYVSSYTSRYTPSSSSAMSISTSGRDFSSGSAATGLTRSPSHHTPVQYHRSLFSTTSSASERAAPEPTRASSIASSYSSGYSSPIKYSSSSYTTSTLGRDREKEREREREVPVSTSSDLDRFGSSGARTSIRNRSTSVSTSYRAGPSVTELNRQAAEREKRDKEREEYKAWEEREREREAMGPAEPLVKDFRRKVTISSSSSTSGREPAKERTTFTVTASGGLGMSNGTAAPAGKYSASSSTYTPGGLLRSEPYSTGSVSPAPSSSSIPNMPPPSYESTYSVKPTAKVTPYEERGTVVPLGFTGLRNIGNTCFMNATLQMLINCVELRTYFVDGHHKSDVNSLNPLGFKGRLAEAFCDFMQQMWSCTSRAIEPARIKELVAEKASQFANFAQHDAHEFLSFLLDGLHEDLNRVKSKAVTGTVEADGRPDIEVATEAWHNHLLRNDSIFVDLFHGQLKSRLQCPKCDKVSITFDPFLYLPVPFPKQKKSMNIYFWPLDPTLKPVKMSVHYSAEGSIADFLQSVGDTVGAQAKNLRMVEVVSHRIHKTFYPDEKATLLSPGDVLYVFQIHSTSDCNEEVIELQAVQRMLYPANLRYVCAQCGGSRSLSACQDCYNVYYCNEECQHQHWESEHRRECRNRNNVEMVGQPFLVSLPKSKCTHAQLMRVLEARCKHSVEVFQPPVAAGCSAIPYIDEGGSPVAKPRRSSKSPSPPVRNGTNGLDAVHPSPNAPPFLNTPTKSDTNSREKSTTPKRQTVMPEQQRSASSSIRSDLRMFFVRKIHAQSTFHGEDLVEEPGDLPLSLHSGTTVAINWRNVREGKPYVSVDTRKHLDVDEERGRKYAAAAAAAGNSGSSSGQIASDPTLQEMLAMFSETERLKPEESWYCNRCKDHVEATKRLELYRLPPVLIIQLKRFVYTASLHTMHRRSKDERRVIYPLENLDLSSFLADGAISALPPVYDLTGVVCHSGSSYFGHYVSMGRLPAFDAAKTEIDWRNFDDSIVTKISPSQVQSDDAYLLFYKQRGFSTRSIFTRHYSYDPAASATRATPDSNGN